MSERLDGTELDALARFADEHELPLDATAKERYARYLALLLEERARTNLIGPLEPSAIVAELFVDSLRLAVLCHAVASPKPATTPAMAATDRDDAITSAEPGFAPVIDVGSGAGFPGLVLAIAWPTCPVVLVEPREQRVRFLERVATELGLTQVQCRKLSLALEDGGKGKSLRAAALPKAGLACAKALTTLPRWLALAPGLLRPDGLVGVLCGAADWAQQGLPSAIGSLCTTPRPLRLRAFQSYASTSGHERVAALLALG